MLPRVVLLVLFVSSPLIVIAQGSIEVIDAIGRKVSLSQPASRIISLSPHTTEMLYVAGAGEQLIAAVDYSDYPAAASKLPRVGGYKRLDLEAILALKPDLVVVWESGNASEQLAQLERLGLTLYYTEPRQLEDIAEDVKKLGKLSGHSGISQKWSLDYLARVTSLRQQYSSAQPVTMFYQIWNQPLMTVNGQHLISEVIRLCGGRNIFSQLPVMTPKV
ncbi:MAG: cobalamin-binding protein, partial [Gammaproteobacteria bacterium]|nr:cobalamin-binding protein [Gammaproteobacteria bacterium]